MVKKKFFPDLQVAKLLLSKLSNLLCYSVQLFNYSILLVRRRSHAADAASDGRREAGEGEEVTAAV